MANVNRPTNIKQKETDVNQKLQLYGIYSGTPLRIALHVWSRVNCPGLPAKNPVPCDHDR